MKRIHQVRLAEIISGSLLQIFGVKGCIRGDIDCLVGRLDLPPIGDRLTSASARGPFFGVEICDSEFQDRLRRSLFSMKRGSF